MRKNIGLDAKNYGVIFLTFFMIFLKYTRSGFMLVSRKYKIVYFLTTEKVFNFLTIFIPFLKYTRSGLMLVNRKRFKVTFR